jgi:hypothetical protein
MEDRILGILARMFFTVAFVLLMIAMVEKGLNVSGLSMPFIEVYPRQVLDWLATPLLFVIAIILKQIRDEARRWRAVRRRASVSGATIHGGPQPTKDSGPEELPPVVLR